MNNLFYTKKELENKPRVFEISLNSMDIAYLKQDNELKKHIGHSFQKLLYIITKNPMLMPTVLDENKTLFEVNKLEKLIQNGINVPKVIYSTDYYFIMEYVGEGIIDYINHNINESEIILKKLIQSLAMLHLKGFIHGGSQIRNFTIKNNQIYMIDFEENVKNEYFDDFKLRDLIIFILSLEKYRIPYEITTLLGYYNDASGDIDTNNKIKNFFNKYKWIKFINLNIFKKLRIKDVRDFVSVIEKVEKIKEDNI